MLVKIITWVFLYKYTTIILVHIHSPHNRQSFFYSVRSLVMSLGVLSSYNELNAYGQTSCQTYGTTPAPCGGIDKLSTKSLLELCRKYFISVKFFLTV
jgi:hypothetical protein